MTTIPLPMTAMRSLLALLIVLGGTGCSIKRLAVNKLGDALAGSGTTFAADDDPELVKAAAPFSLKLMESLLNESPTHKGLLFAASSGFTQYSYAFVQQEAVELEEKDVTGSVEMRRLSQRLYLRARDYALRGLESAHPGFSNALRTDALVAVRLLTKKDVPQTYWAAASWAAAAVVIKDTPELIADLPLVAALMDRALELDEAFDHGAIHIFLISYEMSRPGGTGDRAQRARAHFARAVELSGGQNAGPYVSLAETVAVEQQDRKQFESLLKQALAVNPNARPEWRLANMVMQRRARWLVSQEDNLIEKEEN
jgi:predicted anti-sigma-YlaC factor YlaD